MDGKVLEGLAIAELECLVLTTHLLLLRLPCAFVAEPHDLQRVPHILHRVLGPSAMWYSAGTAFSTASMAN